MNAKYCRKCERFSFSSVDGGKWQCPTCGDDLSKQPHYPAGKVDHSESRRKILKAYETGGFSYAGRRHITRA